MNGISQPHWHSQRPVRNTARGLNELAHHTEAEMATQAGPVKRKTYPRRDVIFNMLQSNMNR